MPHLDDVRRRYADEIRQIGKIRSDAVIAGFATVPRENFLGPGPWQVLRPGSNEAAQENTAVLDPACLYDDVLIAIDPVRGLNNGQPSYLAFCLDSLDLRQGDCVIHVGCGVGYYTAIMAEVVGPAGHVIGIEIDGELAARARRNLAHLAYVEVIHADGGEYAPGACDAIFVNAGATHPRAIWLDPLRLGGRLVLFLTAGFDDSGIGKGGMLKVDRCKTGYAARFLSPVAVFHCVGSRGDEAERRFREAMVRGEWQSVSHRALQQLLPTSFPGFRTPSACFSGDFYPASREIKQERRST